MSGLNLSKMKIYLIGFKMLVPKYDSLNCCIEDKF